ncbi:MAG: ABC transporter permease [Candidatus Muirbacterium halophilum]|nr:ABC transporter permease [Candidatus Muirbacterium halophilum]MCK9477084.1 ABC transporter permease [Candidatus Muirbacterium halophilum]
MNLLNIAWRNIFRNKRRTYLTVSIILVGIMVYIFSLGYVEGMINSSFETSVKNYGHIRVVDNEFELKHRTNDLTANVDFSLAKKIENIKNVKKAVPKLSTGGIVFLDKFEKSVAINCIDSEYVGFLDIDKYILSGEVFSKNTVVVGNKFSTENNIKIGDEITIMVDTQYKSISALNFKVSGIFNNPESVYHNSILMQLDTGQYLLDMDGSVTEILVYAYSEDFIEEIAPEIKKITQKKVEKWYEIGVNAAMISYMELPRTIFGLIFGTLSALGILNTMMMIILERKREIGILEANGLSKFEIIRMCLYEGLGMGAIGIFIGIFIGTLITYVFSIYGMNFGQSMEEIMTSYNMSYIIYPQVKLYNIVVATLFGFSFSFLGTIIPILPYINKKPAELIKE